MKINSINLFEIHVNHRDKEQKKINNINFCGAPRVDKGMERFYETNFYKFPVTVKNFLENLADKFRYTPLEAQRMAFIKLEQAKNINEVKEAFPQEELFKNLKPVKDTKASVGLLSIYREFKDLYPNGILNNEEDLSVYLLKKIFLEAKTLPEINADIDKDLNKDIKDEFNRKYSDNDYIHRSTLESLGIVRPDPGYQNSLKFTREGYSDDFGIKVSQGQLKYWDSLSDEQKLEILSKRSEGRDRWWNNLSYAEKFELATGVDSEEDLYKRYQQFLSKQRKKIQEGEYKQKIVRTETKFKLGPAKIDEGSRDLFNLWLRKNLESFYSLLSEADKDSIHVVRARKLALRWQEMSPSERTELINKMREGREPLRYAMIDTWNHSMTLIKELSAFLKSKQIFKPLDMLYSTQELSMFQSKVMTEFWATHRDLAEEFGKNLSIAISRVESSIQAGQFQDLRSEIIRERVERIKILNQEKPAKGQKINVSEISNSPQIRTQTPENNFRDAYKKSVNKDWILPSSYVDEMSVYILEDFPKSAIERMMEVYKVKGEIPKELISALKSQASGKNYNRVLRMQRAMEAAIAREIYQKKCNPEIFSMDFDATMKACSDILREDLPKNEYPDVIRIHRFYEEYQRDLTKNELNNIVDSYFLIPKPDNIEEKEKTISDYVKTYGRAALIIFSDFDAFPYDVKSQYNDKFLRLMPEKMKNICIPVFRSPDTIVAETVIQQIRRQIAKRFDFMPKEFLTSYTKDVATIMRIYSYVNTPDAQIYSIKSVEENLCRKSTIDGGASPNLKIPKAMPAREGKIQILAAEQALADELFRVTEKENVYELEVEELMNIYEVLSLSKLNDITIVDKDGNVKFDVKSKPNKHNILSKYKEYLEDLQDRADDIFDGDDIKDVKELLYTLNPETDNAVRDKYIMKKIEVYKEALDNLPVKD